MPTGSPAPAPTRLTWAVPALAGAAALALYLPTLAPDLTWRAGGADGGDLLTAAAQGGIAHPTGYPTYTMLAWLFLRLPWGTPAWRVHLLSALAAAGAVGLVSAIAWQLLRQETLTSSKGARASAALLAGLSFAAAPLLWSQATIAEVYSLLAAFMASLTWLALKAGDRLAAGQSARKSLFALAFLSGLALTHHSTILLALIFLWGYVLWNWRAGRAGSDGKAGPLQQLSWRDLGSGVLLFASGLLPLLYLPLRAEQAAMSDWDGPATLDGVWRLISGADYRYLLFKRSLPETTASLEPWLFILVFGLGWLAAPVAGAGFIRLWRTRRAWAVAGALLVGANGAFTAIYAATDTQPYWLVGLVIISGWVGVGLESLYRAIGGQPAVGSEQAVNMQGVTGQRQRRPLGTWHPAFGALLAAVFLLVNSGMLIVLGLTAANRALPGGTPPPEDAPAFLERLEARLPSDAIYLSTADEHTFALWYDRYVAYRRADVLTLDVRLLDQAWFRDNVRQYNPDVAAAIPTAPNGLASFIAAVGRRRAVYADTDQLVIPAGWHWQAQADGLWRAAPP